MNTLGLSVPADSGGTPSVPRALLQGGAVLLGPGGFGIGPVVAGAVDHHTFYRVHGDDGGPREVVRVRLPATDFVMAEMSGGRALMGAHPIQEGPIAAVFPDGSGLVVVDREPASTPDSASWRMRIWDAEGEVEADVSVPYRPVTADGWQERQRRQMMEGRGPDADLAGLEEMFGALQEAWDERAYLPPVTRVEPGYDGTILVRREDAGTGEVTWERFDREGRRTGRFVTEAGFAILAVEADQLWALVTDELDVPSVVRYRTVED